MKKFFLIPVLLLSLFFFVSCVDDEDDDLTDTISGDTGNSDPSDTGSADTDTTPSDTTDTADSGYNPGGDTGADTGSADTGSPDTGTDTGSPDTGDSDTGDTAPAPGPVTCTGFSIEPESLRYEYGGIYHADITDVLGGELKDELVIEFRLEGDPQVKTYNLTYDQADTSTYHNRNYLSCDQCVSVFQDIKTDGNPTKRFFQSSGTLDIEEVDPFNGIKGSLTAKLVEVTIANDGASEPVANGECFEIETLLLDNLCVPDCEGKICGSNGCGGSCGTCTEADEGCSADQKSCVKYECDQVTVNAVEFKSSSSQRTKELMFYNDADTHFWLRIQGLSKQGEFDLAGMTLLENCTGKVFEDDPSGATGWPEQNSVCLYIQENGKFYFPNQGKLNFTKFESNGNLASTVTQGIRLVEISTSDGIPVSGGKCIEITNESINYTAQ